MSKYVNVSIYIYIYIYLLSFFQSDQLSVFIFMCCAFFYNFSNPVDYGDADSSFEAMEEGEEEGEEGMEVDCTPLDATFVVGVGDRLADQGVTT